MERDAEGLIGQIIDNRYLVEAVIGAGGMGVVYRARETGLVDREVALKVISERLSEDDLVRRRFEREVRVIATLRHPNTISLFDAGRLLDGRLFMVMELLHGDSLEARIAQGPIPVEEVLQYFLHITGALSEAHASGVVHRDLKPANVFVDEVAGQRIPRILDFGIAKVEYTDELTATRNIVGTPGFMAPEQCIRGEVSPRSDLYAVGALLFACLAGRPPFEANGEGLMSFLFRTVTEAPPRLGTLVAVDPELESLVHQLLDKAAEQRPADALEVQRRLEGVAVRLAQSKVRSAIDVFPSEAEEVTEAGEPRGAHLGIVDLRDRTDTVSGLHSAFGATSGPEDAEEAEGWSSAEGTFGLEPTVSQDAATDPQAADRPPAVILGKPEAPAEVLAIEAPQDVLEPVAPARADLVIPAPPPKMTSARLDDRKPKERAAGKVVVRDGSQGPTPLLAGIFAVLALLFVYLAWLNGT